MDENRVSGPPAGMVEEFSEKLHNYLARHLVPGPLTYGFEYEFLPEEVMTPERVAEVAGLLPELGFKPLNEGDYGAGDGLHIDFEPGGQLEYGSPPLLGDDRGRFSELLEHIEATNRKIERMCGVRYLARPFIAGRREAPLCLTSPRYRNMHALFGENGGRGREMMKATASIQLHVRLRDFGEMVPLFGLLLKLSRDPDYAMSAERRVIWDHTDTSRCILPEISLPCGEMELLRHLVGHALAALDFDRKLPFWRREKTVFADFLVHLTTIFTDVRLNLKGPTFELRTMDSLPADLFSRRWRRFVNEVGG